MKQLKTTAMILGLALTASANAAVSEEEAAKLGQELTVWGAVASANADGSIPAFTGPLQESEWPEGATVNRPPNPFSDEKPLYTINQDNLDEYRELLSPGTAHMIEKYGDQGYVINVFPTHRTMSYPDWIVENIKFNATNTELADGGMRLSEVRPGPPFPIPQNGLEVLWNHLMRWEGRRWKADSMTFYVDANGNQVLANQAINTVEYPFYNPDIDYGSKQSDFWYIRVDYTAPARRAGEKLLVVDPMDFTGTAGRRSWQYLKGQRRVRRAPAVAFDTPNPGTAGMATYDDAFMFNGSPERYDWKLVGKKELIVPYHNYDLNYYLPRDKSIGEKFVEPDTQRWEKHRVWHVEATLKDGARHVYHRRTLYFDEDTLGAVISDQYDAQGKLWRTLHSIAPVNYALGAGFIGAVAGYDFNAGIYYMSGYSAESKIMRFGDTADIESPSYYTSQGLARGGVR
jgi:hypothetical protein